MTRRKKENIDRTHHADPHTRTQIDFFSRTPTFSLSMFILGASMYILIGFGFVLILLGIIVFVVFIAMYNTLIHLQMTCANTAADLCATWMQKGGKITHPTIVTLIGSCHKASTLDKQVTALNKLRAGILESDDVDLKKLVTVEHTLQTEKRFFNNTARELADRLSIFPTKFIGSVFGINAPKQLDLDEEAQSGILPEAKYL